MSDTIDAMRGNEKALGHPRSGTDLIAGRDTEWPEGLVELEAAVTLGVLIEWAGNTWSCLEFKYQERDDEEFTAPGWASFKHHGEVTLRPERGGAIQAVRLRVVRDPVGGHWYTWAGY